MARSDFYQIANQIGMAAQNSVVFLYRLRQALHISREELQTFRQSLMSFREPIQFLVGGHDGHSTAIFAAQERSLQEWEAAFLRVFPCKHL
ncbi:MAG: hypothetical protein WCB53_10295 [Terriglobales bacterium]